MPGAQEGEWQQKGMLQTELFLENLLFWTMAECQARVKVELDIYIYLKVYMCVIGNM